MKNSKTIVLIHGMFVNNESWKNWKSFFENMGYTVHAPANPGHQGNPSELRDKVHPDLTPTGFETVVNNIVKLIDSLPEKPIVIGHSMAGLVVQKLVELDKVVAGVSIDGAPPKNILPPLSTVKIVWPVINFIKGNQAFMGSFDWYKKAFFNTLSEKDAATAFNEIAVPESRRIARNMVLQSFANVNFKKPHAPLLFIAGGKDNIFPPSLTRKIASSYESKSGITEYKEFQDKSHFICGEPGWEKVAEYIAQWLKKL